MTIPPTPLPGAFLFISARKHQFKRWRERERKIGLIPVDAGQPGARRIADGPHFALPLSGSAAAS
jgi:hypothetical protein